MKTVPPTGTPSKIPQTTQGHITKTYKKTPKTTEYYINMETKKLSKH